MGLRYAKVSWAETLLVLADEFRQGNVLPSEVKVDSNLAVCQQGCLERWCNRG